MHKSNIFCCLKLVFLPFCLWRLKSCRSASRFNQGYHLWVSVMMGFHSTPRVCPSDTHEAEVFLYLLLLPICCISLLFISLHLRVWLSHLRSVFIWILTTSAGSACGVCEIMYSEWNQSAQIDKTEQKPCWVLLVHFLERLGTNLLCSQPHGSRENSHWVMVAHYLQFCC